MEFEPRLGIYRESMNENPLLMKVHMRKCCKTCSKYIIPVTIESGKHVGEK